MQVLKLFFAVAILISLSSYQSKQIIGLWQAEKVYVGGVEKTPNARWVEYKKDGTQRSVNFIKNNSHFSSKA